MKSSGVITKVVVWVLIIAALGLLIYGLAVLGSKDGSVSKTTTINGIQETDHVRGDRNAPIVLVEYGDFQCPACGTAAPLVKQLETELGTKLAVVFRQFPLLNIHQNALQSAYATEAAGKQGKFFEMHDMLYENQEKWSESKDFKTILDSYATQIGLDVAKFDADMDAADVKNKVDDDLASGRKAEVNSTPTFFLNGTKMTIKSYEDFMNQVRNAAANVSGSTSTNSSTNTTANTAN